MNRFDIFTFAVVLNHHGFPKESLVDKLEWISRLYKIMIHSPCPEDQKSPYGFQSFHNDPLQQPPRSAYMLSSMVSSIIANMTIDQKILDGAMMLRGILTGRVLSSSTIHDMIQIIEGHGKPVFREVGVVQRLIVEPTDTHCKIDDPVYNSKSAEQ